MGDDVAANRRGVRWGIAAASVVAAILCLAASSHIYPDGSANLDETAYRAQADPIGDGQLTLDRATHEPNFLPFLSGTHDDEVTFKYQPLWPATIAVADSVGIGEWLLGALMAAAGVIAAAWFAFELSLRRRVAVVVAVLAGLSPALVFQSSTLLAYHPTFVHAAISAALLLRAGRTGRHRLWLAAGLLGGAGLLLRPLDAAIVLVPTALVVWRRIEPARRRRSVGLTAAGGALPFALFLAYNERVNGSPFRLSFNQTGAPDRFGFGRRSSFFNAAMSEADQFDYSLGTALGAQGESLGVLPIFVIGAPIVLAAAAWVLIRRRREPEIRLLAAIGGLVVAAYFLWWGTGNYVDFGLHLTIGPGYHYVLLLPLFTLASIGIADALDRYGSAAVAKWAVAAVVLWIPLNIVAIVHADGGGAARSREVAWYDVEGPALVFAPTEFSGDPYAIVANDAALEQPVLVVHDVGGNRFEVADRFTGRSIHVLRNEWAVGDTFGHPGRRRDQVSVITSTDSLAIHVTGVTPGEGTPTVFAQTAQGLQVFDGPDHIIDIGLADIDSMGSITVGIGHAEDQGFLPRYLCRFDVDRHGDEFRLLDTCNGIQNYRFANGETAEAPEDVRAVLEVQVISREG